MAVARTGSASFNVGTSITLRVSNGRDATLVRRLFERRKQEEDVHVHAERQRGGHSQRAVTRPGRRGEQSAARRSQVMNVTATQTGPRPLPGVGVRS